MKSGHGLSNLTCPSYVDGEMLHHAFRSQSQHQDGTAGKRSNDRKHAQLVCCSFKGPKMRKKLKVGKIDMKWLAWLIQHHQGLGKGTTFTYLILIALWVVSMALTSRCTCAKPLSHSHSHSVCSVHLDSQFSIADHTMSTYSMTSDKVTLLHCRSRTNLYLHWNALLTYHHLP